MSEMLFSARNSTVSEFIYKQAMQNPMAKSEEEIDKKESGTSDLIDGAGERTNERGKARTGEASELFYFTPLSEIGFAKKGEVIFSEDDDVSCIYVAANAWRQVVKKFGNRNKETREKREREKEK